MSEGKTTGKIKVGFKKKGKRLLVRRCLVWLIVLGTLGYSVNGPVARLVIHRYLKGALVEQGLTGDFAIGGSIVSGFRLHDMELTGDQLIRRLSLGSASIRYDLNELVSEQLLRELAVESLTLVVDLDFEAADKEEDEEGGPIWDMLTAIHPLVTAQPIEFSDLDITLLRGGETFLHFTLGELYHKAGSGLIELGDFIAATKEASTPAQDIRIDWQIDSFKVDRIEPLPEFIVENILLAWSEGDVYRAAGGLRLAAAEFDFELNEFGEVSLMQVEDKGLELAEIGRLSPLEVPELSGRVKSLNVKVGQLDQVIARWDIELAVEVQNLVFEENEIGTFVFAVTQRGEQALISMHSRDEGIGLRVESSVDWTSPDSLEWFRYGRAQLKAEVEGLDGWLDRYRQHFDEEQQELLTRFTGGELRLRAEAEASPDGPNRLQSKIGIGGLSYQTNRLPETELALDFALEDELAVLEFSDNGDAIKLSAEIDLAAERYTASLIIEQRELPWLNPLIASFADEVNLLTTIGLRWQGSGGWGENPSHQGELSVAPLQFIYADLPTLGGGVEASYNWPDEVIIEALTANYGEWQLRLGASWAKSTLVINEFEVEHDDEAIASGAGYFPWRAEVLDLPAFLDQRESMAFSLEVLPRGLGELPALLELEESSELSQQLRQVKGVVTGGFHLEGCPCDPQLRAQFALTDLMPADELLPSSALRPPFDVYLDAHTKQSSLNLGLRLIENGEPLAEANVVTPYLPAEWLVSAPDFYELPIQARVAVAEFPLTRVLEFAPDLREMLRRLDGTASLQASLSQTLAAPLVEFELGADVPKLDFVDTDLPDVSDIKVAIALIDQKLNVRRISAEIGGGKVAGQGEALLNLPSLSDPNVEAGLASFELDLVGDHVPVFRDDQVLVRSNARLRLAGNMESAVLSGSVDLVESLFFKDIELIPVGVPSAQVKKIELAAVDAVTTAGTLPIPEPFDQWKLDLGVNLKDPFLIRGNLARGQVTGGIKVGGTFSEPRPVGNFNLEKIRARLPFSTVRVDNSRVTFREDSGLDPQLEINARSKISNYDISIFVYGAASNPTVAFSSNPPLSREDILTLIATGTTTSGLGDSQVASMKAFQLLISELQRRFDRPDGNRLFAKVLGVVDDLDLSVGESDPFTSRQFTSASIKFNENWNFTAQFDQEGNSRGLIVFSIRLK